MRRKPDSRDRRVKLVELLPPSVPIIEQVADMATELEEEVFGVLTDTHRKQLRQDLIKVRKRVQEMLGKSS